MYRILYQEIDITTFLKNKHYCEKLDQKMKKIYKFRIFSEYKVSLKAKEQDSM